MDLAIAAQSAGAATGNSLAPGDALLGATIAGASGKLGEILSRNLPWALLVLLLVSAASVAFYLLL